MDLLFLVPFFENNLKENLVWFWTFIVNFRTLCNITFWTLNWWCRVLVPYKTSLPRDGFDWTLCDSCLVHKRVHLIGIDDITHLISDRWQGEIYQIQLAYLQLIQNKIYNKLITYHGRLMDFQNPRKLPKTIGVKNEITNRIPNKWGQWGFRSSQH